MKAVDVLERLESAAVGQKGLITATQAKRGGVDRVQLQRLDKAGVITRIRHGVYCLPSAESTAQLEIRAAWLHLDPTRFAGERLFDDHKIAVSHVSAADVHGLGVMIPARHEFTANYRKQSSQDDIHVRRGSLDDDTVIVDGLLVTSIPRTVADLARARIEFDYLADIVADAVGRTDVRIKDLARALDRWAGRYDHRSGTELIEACRKQAGESLDAVEELARLSPAARRRLDDAAAAAIAPAVTSHLNAIIGAQLADLVSPNTNWVKVGEQMTRHTRDVLRQTKLVATTVPAVDHARISALTARQTELSETLKKISTVSSIGTLAEALTESVTLPQSVVDAALRTGTARPTGKTGDERD